MKQDLIAKIEKLRSNLLKVKEGRPYTDREVIRASQELDAVLDQYQEMQLTELHKQPEFKKTGN